MNSIEKIKSRLPENVRGYYENAIKERIIEYVKEELGEEAYQEYLDNPTRPSDIDAISQDFENGFWFAVELFNINFKQPN